MTIHAAVECKNRSLSRTASGRLSAQAAPLAAWHINHARLFNKSRRRANGSSNGPNAA